MDKKTISDNTKFYDNTCEELKFLLGGIGTGSVSLGARGNLCDFEVMNEPKKDFTPPNTFFALRFSNENEPPLTRVLEARLNKYNRNCLGFPASDMAGLPRFERSVFSSRYPFAYVDFFDKAVPLDVKLTAFTPFIPLDEDSSSLPLFVMRYFVKNTGKKTARVSIAGTLSNLCGYEGAWDVFNNIQLKSRPFNEGYVSREQKGVLFLGELDKNERYYNEFALFSDNESVTLKPEWLNAAWQDSAFEFWDDFKSDGRLENAKVLNQVQSVFDAKPFSKSGSVCIEHTIAPNESKEFEFLVAWYSPNRYYTWFQDLAAINKDRDCYKNYYAYQFDSALSVVKHYYSNKEYLNQNSQSFSDALYSSTMPREVIDAVAANIPIIRSTTCFRAFESGKFFAFEGSSEKFGFCDGNCSHVWNYAQTLAFLFPKLEKSMRRTEFLTDFEENGHIPFRVRKDFNDARWDLPPAADGQLGSIIRIFREWKISKDDSFLKELFPNVNRAMDYCIATWDKDEQGLLSGMQHNTYDIEFYGNTSMLQSIYCTALKAYVEMASYLSLDCKRYEALLEKSQLELNKLFNGEYFIQAIEDVNTHKYQYGQGCLSDQLFGLMLARSYNLDLNLVDKEAEKTALKSIFKYNFQTDFFEHENLQRVYALNDDKGLLLCSFKKGLRPIFPFVYADEVWAGIEYQVAAHLALVGLYEECFSIVEAVRDRYNGKKRNPFAETECGYHYARSLASFAVYRALAGFSLDGTEFNPYKKGDFSALYIDLNEWGIIKRTKDGITKTPLWQADKKAIDKGK